MSIPFQLRFERDLEVLETRMNQIAASDQFYTGHDLRHVARMASILRNRMKEYNNAKERFSEELRDSRQSSGSNRKFVWARQGGSAAVDTDQGLTIDLLQEFQTAYGADILGSTITRIRGVVQWNLGDVAVAGLAAITAIRTADQTELQADAEGPLTSYHADWMAFVPTILDDSVPSAWHQEIDVRSQRKMEELGRTLALSFETDAADATTAIEVKYFFSVGLKLP